MALKNNTPERVRKAAQAEERKRKEREAAQRQADRDALVKPTDPVITLKKGETLTLHEQNVLARKRNAEARNRVREASIAAGKAVGQVLGSGGSVRISQSNGQAVAPVHGVNTAAIVQETGQLPSKTKSPAKKAPAKKAPAKKAPAKKAPAKK